MIPYVLPVSPSNGEFIKILFESYPIFCYVFICWLLIFQLFSFTLVFDMLKHSDDWIEKSMHIILGFGLFFLFVLIDFMIYESVQ